MNSTEASSVNRNQINPPGQGMNEIDPKGLIFATGFEGETAFAMESPNIPQYDDLIGVDDTVERGDWVADLETNNTFITKAVIYYEDEEDDRNKRSATLESEAGNRFLIYTINQAHITVPNPMNPTQD